ncbi:MAG: hypothetical protein KJ556_12590, partial [Gammaproteobacteria bacterium]|nr:hypothetical protein [Gammaproteobacteria bacterium]
MSFLVPSNAASKRDVVWRRLTGLLAAYTELSRLAALANPNNGKLLVLKTKPVKCETASQPEPI